LTFAAYSTCFFPLLCEGQRGGLSGLQIWPLTPHFDLQKANIRACPSSQ